MPPASLAETARFVLVAVGTPVAVNTPVGIDVVVEDLLPRESDCDELGAPVEGGALTITLEGGTVGLPATLLMLSAGVDHLADSLYSTPLIRAPARFAIMFF